MWFPTQGELLEFIGIWLLYTRHLNLKIYMFSKEDYGKEGVYIDDSYKPYQ